MYNEYYIIYNTNSIYIFKRLMKGFSIYKSIINDINDWIYGLF